ncbi:unnamed protein product, partial [marine sediment metagenome]
TFFLIYYMSDQRNIDLDIVESYLDFSRYIRQYTSDNHTLLTQIEEGMQYLIRNYIPEREITDHPTSNISDIIGQPQISRQRFRNILRRPIRENTSRYAHIRPTSASRSSLNTAGRPRPRQPSLDNGLLRLDIPRFLHLNNTNLPLSNLSPITVRPTASQVARATEQIRFSDVINPTNNQCPITRDDFSDSDNILRIRHCDHLFNQAALTRWFNSHVRCPLCRYDIREYTVPTVTTSTETHSALSHRDNRLFSNIANYITDEITNSLDSSANTAPVSLEYTFFTQNP